MTDGTTQTPLLVLGTPAKTIKTPEGTLQLWSSPPFLATYAIGYANEAMAKEIDLFYRAHRNKLTQVVTVHDWGEMTDYDSAARKILQQLTHYMSDIQKEILIYLGPANSLAQKVVRTTVDTITRFRKMPIEIYDTREAFQKRFAQLQEKYKDAS